MKTQTKRIRKNTGTKPAPVQAQNPVSPAKTIPEYTLELQSFADGKSFCEGKIVIPPDKMKILFKKAAHPIIEGIECADFAGVLEKGLEAMAEESGLDELEDALRQSNALTTLLYEHIEGRRTGSHFNNETESGGEMLCGLQFLVWSTRDRLQKAGKALRDGEKAVAS